MKNKILMVIMTGISVFLSLSLIAADVYYSISPVDVYWHTGGNWTSSAVPTSADNVGITRTYAPTPVRILSGESYLVNKLTLSQGIVPGEDYLGGLWLEGTLTNTLSLSVGDLGPGRLLVDGGKVVTVNGSLQVGYDTTNAQGAFIMSNGVAVARADMRIGVSNGAQGEVSWVDSAAAVLGYLRVGLGSGTQGAFYLDNTTVNVYSGTSGPGAMRIGETGTGMVSQNGGELNLVGFLTIGRDSGSSGTYINEGGSFKVGTALVTGSHLAVGASGYGEMQLRGATLNIYNQSTLKIRTDASGTGIVKGWGDFHIVALTAPNYVENNGLVVADGEGAAHDLNMTDFYKSENTIANGTDGTNGWYAVNKGRLRYPRAFMNSATVEVGQGDAPGDSANDLVNSIHLSFTGKEGPDYLRGELYATDRNDIPAGLPSNAARRVLGVWRLPLEKSFSTASLRFRYDRSGVSDDDDIELYRRNSSGVWTVVGTAAGASDAVSTTAPLAPVSSGEGYLGWFAVVSVEQNGTLITIM